MKLGFLDRVKHMSDSWEMYVEHQSHFDDESVSTALKLAECVPVLLDEIEERDNTIARVRAVLDDAWPEDGAGSDVVHAEAVLTALDPQETP